MNSVPAPLQLEREVKAAEEEKDSAAEEEHPAGQVAAVEEHAVSPEPAAAMVSARAAHAAVRIDARKRKGGFGWRAACCQ